MKLGTNKIQGWLLLDKPKNVSSQKALNPIKAIMYDEKCNFKKDDINGQKNNSDYKIGHTGTLDPFASGLLIAAIGKSTKLIEYATNLDKSYSFSVIWGEEKDTDDITGQTIKSSSSLPNKLDLKKCIQEFSGKIIAQKPPNYSAIHINGRRAYNIARSTKEDISNMISPKRVKCYKLINTKNITNEKDEIIQSDFDILCSKGFYIRSLGRDMGRLIKTYGFISQLKRNSIGPFIIKDAICYSNLSKMEVTQNIISDEDFFNALYLKKENIYKFETRKMTNNKSYLYKLIIKDNENFSYYIKKIMDGASFKCDLTDMHLEYIFINNNDDLINESNNYCIINEINDECSKKEPRIIISTYLNCLIAIGGFNEESRIINIIKMLI